MKFIWALTLFCLIASHTQACFHYPGKFKGILNEGRKEVFLFHDGKDAHMVIRTSLSAAKFPREIAWVLPFPSLPSKIEEIDGPIFEEIRGLFSKLAHEKGAYGSSLGAFYKATGIKVHEPVTLSNYVIQPIEITKNGSAKEFNAWLTKNKFNPMPVENQKYYLKKGAVFLAIRMQLNRPDLENLRSRPLHIVYKADQVSVPIKFSHDSRTFGMDLFVFSKQEMKKDQVYLTREESIAYKNERLNPLMDRMIGAGSGFVTLYRGHDLNSKDKPLKDLAQDPIFLKSEL